jgi:hypothetical protein
MITGEGLVAKVVTFIVEKSFGKLASLVSDKKRKACRALTKLYYCMQALDDATERMLQTFTSFRQSGDGPAKALVQAFNNNSHIIEQATNMFIDLSWELQPGLEIIDPALASCCGVLYAGKMDFLTYMSTGVRWVENAGKCRITLKRPRGLMEAADMESMYVSSAKALADGEKWYWPRSSLDNFHDDFQDVYVEYENDQVGRELHQMILEQNLQLKRAKEQLRKLIISNFSIEQVLFESGTRPQWFWF